MREARDIYYLELKVDYLVSKHYKSKETWLVAYTDDILEILDDPISVGMLNEQLYKPNHKGEKKVIIKKILSSKKIGKEVVNN
jgi:hypothetical protein